MAAVTSCMMYTVGERCTQTGSWKTANVERSAVHNCWNAAECVGLSLL